MIESGEATTTLLETFGAFGLVLIILVMVIRWLIASRKALETQIIEERKSYDAKLSALHADYNELSSKAIEAITLSTRLIEENHSSSDLLLKKLQELELVIKTQKS